MVDKAEVEKYLTQHYAVGFKHDDGSYFVQVIGCKGCMSQGDTFEEACVMIVDAFSMWVETCLEDGLPIPEPPGRPLFYEDWTAIVLMPFVRNIAKITDGLGFQWLDEFHGVGPEVAGEA